MKTIMRYLICLALSITAAPGTSQPQSAAQDRLDDIKAQYPQEKIFASAPCQRALQDPGKGWITQHYKADPTTFVENLSTLMEKSDEVILAGFNGGAVVLSPTGQSVTTYIEVRVVRSWKGPHHTGDLLIFGVPYGSLPCESYISPETFTRRFDVQGPYISVGNLYVLFLRQSKGDETKLVQGLFPAAGEGAQGIFEISVPAASEVTAEDYCVGAGGVNVQHCETIMQASQIPVVVPYRKDPLAKKYNGMPASAFLQEIQSVAAGQGVAEKSSPK